MLQGDKYRYDIFFIFCLIDIDTVSVMDGEKLLGDDGDDVFIFVIKFEVESQDVSP